MRCLLIEDNAANAYLVEVLLKHRGHDVSELARESTYESVCQLLWGGEPDASPWESTVFTTPDARRTRTA